MNEQDSRDSKVVNTFDAMWMDSLLSQVPSGAYIEAWNAVNSSDEENSYGISNEPSNELFVNVPGQVRGLVYVEERDQYVVFVDNPQGGEIGLISEKLKTYTQVTNTNIAAEIGITADQWIDCEVKVMQPCNNLYLYWSSGDVYKRINLDDPCCEFETIPLITPVCLATIETGIVEQAGRLANGVYQFAAKARDIEGNDSNWSRISNTISISGGDNKPGERSARALNLEVRIQDDRNYHIVDLAVIKTIDGITLVEEFATVTANSGQNTINYLYTGDTGRERPMQLSEILTRVNRYIRGKNLIQYDNRLVLYNLRPIHNLDYQRQANEIEAKYQNYIVPLDKAELFKGLRPNENYWFAIRWNYADGTSSVNYVIPGQDGGPELCDPYVDTSSRCNLYIDLSADLVDDNPSVDPTTDNSPTVLFEDESTSVIVTPEDEPTIDDEINSQIGGIGEIDMGSTLDCLCDKAARIASAGPGTFGGLFNNVPVLGNLFGSWDLDDDVIGAITLSQILCMCEARGPYTPPGQGGGTPPPVYGGDQPEFGGRPEGLVQLSPRQASEALAALERAPYTQAEDNRSEGTAAVIGARCSQEGYLTCNNNICQTCQGGVWKSVRNVDSYPTNSGYSRNLEGQASQVLSLKEQNSEKKQTSPDLGFEYEYAEDGCTVIGVKPLLYSDGKFGAWTTQEVYPETLDCDCEYIYGPLAGKNVRLHKAPSVSKEPHFASFASGVPNKYDMANSEFTEGYAFMLGVQFNNITLPANPPKPLCLNNPYSITHVERTESNKTVIGSGLGHSCFLGEVGGEQHAFPKHAINSFERFDRHIEPNGPDTFRGGGPCDVGAYVVHSPDFHMRRPPLDATECLIEMEMFGKGFRHGTMALGEKPESISQDRLNQKGTRQAVNVNHYIQLGEPIVRSVRSMSSAPADSVVSKSNRFTYNLCNLQRESSVYMELDGIIQPFSVDTPAYGGVVTTPDGASDRSFTGDIFTESLPIHSARGHYMTFIRRLPSQYGSPISQAYIPLGLEARSFKPTISGLVGDSFSGAMTYKRTALISDKTNRMISRFVAAGGIAGGGIISRVLGNLFAALFRVLGLRNGGYIPLNQDPSDHIRIFGGLRLIHGDTQGLGAGVTVDNPGEVATGQIPPRFPVRDPRYTTRTSTSRDVNHGDNYFPQHLKTQVTSFFNSDAALHYRELGDVDNGDVYYSEEAGSLKGLKIDSSMPEDTPWQLGWLNRYYSEWKENAKWKLIVQGVFTFVFTFVIGLWLIVEGIGYIVTGAQAIGGGTFGLQTAGAIVAMIIGLVILLLGIAWLVFWIQSDVDNRIIEEYVGLKNIRPDRRNVDGSFSMNENRVRQFENNFFRCDSTHSQVNMWEVSFGMSDPYNTCTCPTDYHNKILYSNRQTMDSQIDFWQNFKPNNSLEITSEHGKLSKMFQLGNSLYAHTTDMLIQLGRGSGQFSLDEGALLLGQGNLFGAASPIYGGVVEGFAGLKDPNASEVTGFGYVFPDREARKWYIFSGQQPSPVSNAGVKHFMDENMQFELLEAFPTFAMVDLKLVGGIGYSLGVDHENERLLFTKTDYKPIDDRIKLNDDKISFNLGDDVVSVTDEKYFDNKSFTLSYSLRRKSWTSFHNYTPHLYAWNRFDMYSFGVESMWQHNVKGNFQTFYGEHYPFSVEYAVNSPQQADSFAYTSSVMGTEAYKWKDTDYISVPVTFESMIGYNSHQSTGNKDFVDTDNLSLSERSNQDDSVIHLHFRHRIWTFKDVVNHLISDEEFMFDPNYNIGPKPVNENNISRDSKNNIFYDNYFANRLIFSTFDDVKLILKRMETNISYDSR